MNRYVLLFIIAIICIQNAFAQEKEFEQWAALPKTATLFPLDYKISRPRLQYPLWDNDYDRYYAFINPVLKRTQASFSYTDKGVVTSVIPNAIMQHAQLDTATMVKNNTAVIGTWRMLVYRSLRYNDSVYLPTKIYYRLPDTLLEDKSKDEAFAIFTDDHFKLYAKEAGKTKYKKVISSKYKIENTRFLMLYKLSRSAAGVSQFGIDEKGYLVLNYPKVIENVKNDEYFSYYTIIEQYIF